MLHGNPFRARVASRDTLAGYDMQDIRNLRTRRLSWERREHHRSFQRIRRTANSVLPEGRTAPVPTPVKRIPDGREDRLPPQHTEPEPGRQGHPTEAHFRSLTTRMNPRYWVEGSQVPLSSLSRRVNSSEQDRSRRPSPPDGDFSLPPCSPSLCPKFSHPVRGDWDCARGSASRTQPGFVPRPNPRDESIHGAKPGPATATACPDDCHR